MSQSRNISSGSSNSLSTVSSSSQSSIGSSRTCLIEPATFISTRLDRHPFSILNELVQSGLATSLEYLDDGQRDLAWQARVSILLPSYGTIEERGEADGKQLAKAKASGALIHRILLESPGKRWTVAPLHGRISDLAPVQVYSHRHPTFSRRCGRRP